MYVVQFYTGSLLYPLLNIFFRVTFLCFLMLAMLVFTHSMYTKQPDRDLVSFYMPKFAVVGTLWCIGAVTYIFSEFNKIQNPTYSVETDNPYYRYVVIGLFITMAAYLLMLWYHLSKALARMAALPTKYSSVFLVVWGAAMTSLCLCIMAFFAVYAFGKMTETVLLIFFQVFFNLYPMMAAVLFLPSNERETMADFQDASLSFEGIPTSEDMFTLGNESD